MKPTEIVHLEWIDSSSQDGWMPIEEYDDAFHTIHTVGFLLDFDSSRYLVALSYDPESDSVNGTIQIPTSCVTKVTLLCTTKTLMTK